MRHFIGELVVIAGVIALGALTNAAQAVQRLVRPTESLQDLEKHIKPGDVLILMPGRHRAANFSNLRGTAEKPIVIRAVDPKDPPIIEAGRYGLQFHRSQYVVLEDMVVTGATINGVLVDDAPRSTDGKRHDANLTFRRVTVLKTGPEGQRDAFCFSGVSGVHLDSCRVEGWGGSAVSMAACADVDIVQSSFIGMEHFTQLTGIWLRSGCESVTITRCKFERAGQIAVLVGPTTDPADFHPSLTGNVPTGSIYEARGLAVDRCLFLYCGQTFSLAHANDWEADHNTIVRPHGLVLGLELREMDLTFARGGKGSFAFNLIVWQSGDISRLSVADDTVGMRNIAIGRNLWWCNEPPDQREKLGQLPGRAQREQIMHIDPKLDDDHHPHEVEAELFGVNAP